MEPFVHRSRDHRIVFGAGTRRRIGEELDALDARRVVGVSGGSATVAARAIADAVAERITGTFGEVVPVASCEHCWTRPGRKDTHVS